MLGRTDFRPAAGRSRALGRAAPPTLALLAGLLPAPGLAEPVRIDTLEGTLEYRSDPDSPWQAARGGQTLTLPAEVRTGTRGTTVLRQAGSELELKPGTELVLTPAETGPLLGQISQKTGTVFYRIADDADTLKVETSNLTSTVHGTRFVIVATETDSFVTLTEGDLQVTDLDSGDSQNLDPGEVIAASVDDSGMQQFNQIDRASQADFSNGDSAAEPTMIATEPAPGEEGFDAAFAAMDEVAAEAEIAAAVGSGELDFDDEPTDDLAPDLVDDMPDPVEDDLAVDDESPMEDDIPEDSGSPVEDDMPDQDQGPVEDDMPDDSDHPVEDDMPGEDREPVEDDMPDDEGPVEDDMPGEHPSEEDEMGDDGDGVTHCFLGHCHTHPDWDGDRDWDWDRDGDREDRDHKHDHPHHDHSEWGGHHGRGRGKDD